MALLKNRTIELDAQCGVMLENSVNTLYGNDVNHTFEFAPTIVGGKRGVAYGLTRDATPSMVDEMRKGGELFILAGVARMFGQCKHVKIDGIQKRWFGKLTTWCRAHMGLSTHQVERDVRRHGRPSADLPHLAVDVESESQEE